MTRMFTCFPPSDYDVIIVSNGTDSQIQEKLAIVNSLSSVMQEGANITFKKSLKDLIFYLDLYKNEGNRTIFEGKIIFMFFNGLDFIQDTLCELIDEYSNRLMPQYSLNEPFCSYQEESEILRNTFFYFDSSINPGSVITMINIASDVLKKSLFLVGRIRGLYIDDINLVGSKLFALNKLQMAYPTIENIKLTSIINESNSSLVI